MSLTWYVTPAGQSLRLVRMDVDGRVGTVCVHPGESAFRKVRQAIRDMRRHVSA